MKFKNIALTVILASLFVGPATWLFLRSRTVSDTAVHQCEGLESQGGITWSKLKSDIQANDGILYEIDQYLGGEPVRQLFMLRANFPDFRLLPTTRDRGYGEICPDDSLVSLDLVVGSGDSTRFEAWDKNDDLDWLARNSMKGLKRLAVYGIIEESLLELLEQEGGEKLLAESLASRNSMVLVETETQRLNLRTTATNHHIRFVVVWK